MNKPDNKNSSSKTNARSLWQFIAALMTVVVLSVFLLTAYHHHDDLADHDSDCSICLILNHRLAEAVEPFSGLAYLPLILAVLSAALNPAFAFSRYYHSPQKRAPPVF